MSTQSTIHEFVQTILRRRGDACPFGEGDSLVLSGRLDSLAVMEVAELLEAKFGVDFARRGFDPLDFDTIGEIAAVAVGDAK